MKAKLLLTLAFAALPLAACNNNQPASTTSDASAGTSVISQGSQSSGEAVSNSSAKEESQPAAASSQEAGTSTPATTSVPSQQSQPAEGSQGGEASIPETTSAQTEGSVPAEESVPTEESIPGEGSDPAGSSEAGSEEEEPYEVTLVFKNIYNDGEMPANLALGGVKLSMAKGSGSNEPKYYSNGEDLRFYANNKLTVEGIGITKVEFILSEKEGVFSADSGSIDSDSSSLVDTWTGEAKDKIEFTVTSGQRRIKSMIITCADLLDTPEVPGEEEELEGETVVELVINFFAVRGININYAPGLTGIPEDDLAYVEYELDFYLEDEDWYSPYFYVEYDADISEQLFANLTSEGFEIPDEADPEWGYECINENDGIEVDVEIDDPYTCITFYALDDISGE